VVTIIPQLEKVKIILPNIILGGNREITAEWQNYGETNFMKSFSLKIWLFPNNIEYLLL
jgi:hypothetical protein